MKRSVSPLIIRNIVFGVEDSLVSTVGFLSGIAAADVERSTLFLSGLVLIVVEALSMGVGSLLSEASVQELSVTNANKRTVIGAGFVMFLSYFASGFIPLAPYFIIPGPMALPLSVALSLIALFILGYASGRIGKGNNWTSALRMLLLGGLAILAGIAVGRIMK